MKWSVIRPKILEVISSIPGIKVYWRDRERAFVSPEDGATCLLHVIAASDGPGEDDFRYEHNTETNLLDVTQAGIRLFTLSIVVESYDQADDKTALEYIEDIRDALFRPQILALLLAENLAVRDVAGTSDLSHTEDDHAVSSASMDVFFAYGNNKTSADGPGLESVPFIETVQGEDGAPVGFTRTYEPVSGVHGYCLNFSGPRLFDEDLRFRDWMAGKVVTISGGIGHPLGFDVNHSFRILGVINNIGLELDDPGGILGPDLNNGNLHWTVTS